MTAQGRFDSFNAWQAKGWFRRSADLERTPPQRRLRADSGRSRNCDGAAGVVQPFGAAERKSELIGKEAKSTHLPLRIGDG
jgi:hypothetical protein